MATCEEGKCRETSTETSANLDCLQEYIRSKGKNKCKLCKISPKLLEEIRLPQILVSSMLNNSRKFGDHIDLFKIVLEKAKISKLQEVFLEKHRMTMRKQIDVLFVGGLEELKEGKSVKEVLGEIRDFRAKVVGTMGNSRNTFAVSSLPIVRGDEQLRYKIRGFNANIRDLNQIPKELEKFVPGIMQGGWKNCCWNQDRLSSKGQEMLGKKVNEYFIKIHERRTEGYIQKIGVEVEKAERLWSFLIIDKMSG